MSSWIRSLEAQRDEVLARMQRDADLSVMARAEMALRLERFRAPQPYINPPLDLDSWRWQWAALSGRIR